MPPTKKRKNKKNSGPAAKKKTSKDKDTKLQKLLTDKSWKETIQCLKRETEKEEGERPRFLPLAYELKAPINVIRALIKARPKEASQRDDNGRLPLHTMISGTGYMDQSCSLVVEALLDAYPEAAQQCDDNGLCPLQHACARSASSKLIEKILKLYTDGANQTATYKVNFSHVRRVSFKEWLPLHVACCERSNLNIIKMLANANPQALQKQTSTAEGCESGLDHQNYSVLEFYRYMEPALAYYCNMEPEQFEKLNPFQWSFKSIIYHHGRYRNFPEEQKSVLVFLLTMTYPNICSVEEERFYEQGARCLRNVISGKGKNTSTYNDNSFLLLHYALLCGAPLDVIQTISEKRPILLERNKDDELPMHCALDTGNVSAAIHLIKLRSHYHKGQQSPFLCNERDRKGRWPLHVALTKCSPYDDRRNRLLRLMYDPNHKSAGMHLKLGDDDQLLQCPLQNYLLTMIMTPDADPRQGCGGVATICPIVVRDFILACPSAVVTPLRCQRIRSEYRMLVATVPGGVSLYPFQILCLLFSDMFLSNVNFSSGSGDGDAFWEEKDSSHTNSILTREMFNSESGMHDPKVDHNDGVVTERDVVTVEILFEMLRLNPAAIATKSNE